MPRYDYEIGASMATLTNVKNLSNLRGHERVEPRGLAVEPYSVYHTSASGLAYGDGFPRTKWTFDLIYQEQLDALLDYLNGNQSAVVYIKTRKDDRTYAYYRAVMHRPIVGDEMTPLYDNRWGPVEIRFTMLEEQTPET